MTLVSSMAKSKQQLYLADYQNSRILILGEEFNLIREIGRQGQGPGELQGVFGIRVANGLLFAHNQFAWKMEVFDLEGSFIKTVLLPDIPMDTSFAVDKGCNIYMPSFNKSSPISSYDFDGNLVARFGEWVKPESRHLKGPRNKRFLDMARTPNGEEVLIAVCQSEPLIEVYRLDGGLLIKKDFQGHPLLRKRQDFAKDWRKENPHDSGIHIVFQNLYIQGSSIYVLFYSEKRADQIMRLRLRENDLVLTGHYQLEHTPGIPLSAHSFLKLTRGYWLAFENTSSMLHLLRSSDIQY